MSAKDIDLIHERALAFKMLHEQPGLFVIPNPWDAGSSKMLESLGFKALATTSAGLAYSLAKPDGHASIKNLCRDRDRGLSCSTQTCECDHGAFRCRLLT